MDPQGDLLAGVSVIESTGFSTSYLHNSHTVGTFYFALSTHMCMDKQPAMQNH